MDLLCQIVFSSTLRVLGLLGASVAQVTILPVGNRTEAEEDPLTITCTDSAELGSTVFLRENGGVLMGNNGRVNGMMRVYDLRVDRTQDGNTYDCESGLTAEVSLVLTLNVICK